MPRKNVKIKKRITDKNKFNEWYHFLTVGGKRPGEREIDAFLRPEGEIKKDWDKYKDEVMERWVKENPGKRPWSWWKYEAPELPRKRIGGIGTPRHEVLAYKPIFSFGIPVSYVDDFSVEYYNGRAKDIHGKLIPCKWRDGDFKGVAVDPEDPPRYESEFEYLKRHNLLYTNEK